MRDARQVQRNSAGPLVEAENQYLELLMRVLTASLYEESAWRIVQGPLMGNIPRSAVIRRLTAVCKRGVVRWLARRGLMLVRRQPFRAELREAGIDWPCFGYSMVGHARLRNIRFCVEDVLQSGVPGDFVETGVWRGGCTIWMKAILKAHKDDSRVIWCADSFEGLPPPSEDDRKIEANSDFSDVDYLKVSVEQVRRNFELFGLLDDKVRFLQGWFKDTLPSAPVEKIAVLRLDADLYESTMDALRPLYHRVSRGGYVIVDDYHTWPGCKRAVDEFRESVKSREPLHRIDGAACYWKVGEGPGTA